MPKISQNRPPDTHLSNIRCLKCIKIDPWRLILAIFDLDACITIDPWRPIIAIFSRRYLKYIKIDTLPYPALLPYPILLPSMIYPCLLRAVVSYDLGFGNML